MLDNFNLLAITETQNFLQTIAIFPIALYIRPTRKSLCILFNAFVTSRDDRQSVHLYSYELFYQMRDFNFVGNIIGPYKKERFINTILTKTTWNAIIKTLKYTTFSFRKSTGLTFLKNLIPHSLNKKFF